MSADHTDLLSPGQEKNVPGKGSDKSWFQSIFLYEVLVRFLLTLPSHLILEPEQNKPTKRQVSSLGECASDVAPENFVTKPAVLLLPQTAQVC